MKKEIEVQQENIQKLIKLANENPELRIIPMVDSDVVLDDSYGCWSGKWSCADVDECWCNDERIYFKSSDYDELIEEYMEKWESNLPVGEEEIENWAKEQVDNLEWEKVITVNIRAL